MAHIAFVIIMVIWLLDLLVNNRTASNACAFLAAAILGLSAGLF